MVKFTTAAPADIPQLIQLLEILFSQEADFQPDSAKQQRALEMIIRSPTAGTIYVASSDDQIIGMVSLLFVTSTAMGGPACFLEDLVVRPEFRGAGVGTGLLEHAINEARAAGLTRITLLTDADNDGAIKLYKKYGFELSQMRVLRLYL
ncbi:MAG: GNAT family N-acetyltransferase [Planctomycetota bacterium]|nr:GNAT family N-acetyltransferase [Planctomycetota bacterium]